MSSIIYTSDEVARHNGESDTEIWIIIKNIVYDVTQYINEHPGGEDLILEYAGGDATAGFSDFGHSSDALNTLKHHKIGQVIKAKGMEDEDEEGRITNKDAMKINRSERKNRRFWFPWFRGCAL